jgi:hypothetical protein
MRPYPPHPCLSPGTDPPAHSTPCRAATPPLLPSTTAPALPIPVTPSVWLATRVRAELLLSTVYPPSTPPFFQSLAPAQFNAPGLHNPAPFQLWVSLLCQPAALSTPQGDGTGLSGCPQGLVPEWPVIQSLAPNARQLSPIGHPRVHVSPIYCIPNVLLANHTRSPFHRPTPRSTFASRSIKRSPSRRAS